jgi:hypothetical protein
MYEVNIEQQYRAMKELVYDLASNFEGADGPALNKIFPTFIIGSCYNMLSANKGLPTPIKAVLLDHSIKISRIRCEFSGFEIVLALDKHRDMGGLRASLPDFRGCAENFWRTLWAYAKESGQKEAFKSFLVMYRIYMQAILDDLRARNPDLRLSACCASPDPESFLSEMDPVV